MSLDKITRDSLLLILFTGLRRNEAVKLNGKFHILLILKMAEAKPCAAVIPLYKTVEHT
jgi:hypothetical protein